MSTNGPKQTVFTCLAEIAQALGHAHRLELLEHLGQGESSVEELAARAHLTFANTSRHLQILRRARLVEPRREGKRMLYSLAGDDEIVLLLRALGRVGERNVAEIEVVMAAYFRARDELEPVSREELVTRLRDGLVTLLDVRPEDEFALGHLRGALNVPLAALEQHFAGVAAGQGGHRLLPRPLLRALLRGGCRAPGARLQCPPAGGRISGMEGIRPAGRGDLRLNVKAEHAMTSAGFGGARAEGHVRGDGG